MGESIDDCSGLESVFDEIDVGVLLDETPGFVEAEEMANRNLE